ncbi:MAG TPA: prepilin-type N-terminal cleavage/methylation domain-containing protein, partial [Opitutaceae bacterium]|nr:prepilin-type N-terminal cleavage/methylation domain-containing protein [Opitutaceae bacterium]
GAFFRLLRAGELRFTARVFFMRRLSRVGRSRAFTLVELLTVIAVIAILASLAVGLIRGAQQRAMLARAKSELALLTQALEAFKRVYGDYPQTGPSAANSQRVTGTVGPGLASAQAVLFNALIGVYGPAGSAGGRLNGPLLVDISKFTLEVPLASSDLATFAIPVGTPPAKPAVNNAFVDPWGNRYLYFYKRSGAAASPWSAPAYVLYSAGPDGASTNLPSSVGFFSGTSRTAGDNADNLYADQLP